MTKNISPSGPIGHSTNPIERRFAGHDNRVLEKEKSATKPIEVIESVYLRFKEHIRNSLPPRDVAVILNVYFSNLLYRIVVLVLAAKLPSDEGHRT